MRFFSGIRGGDKKRVSASALYKEKTSGKQKVEKTITEKYQEMLDAKIMKMTEDAMMGLKKGAFQMPGTKRDDKPKELSKNAKLMLKLLAMQKMRKDEKKEKKKLKEMLFAAKSKKKAEAYEKTQKEEQIEFERRQAEEAAVAHTTASSWWGVGLGDDNQ